MKFVKIGGVAVVALIVLGFAWSSSSSGSKQQRPAICSACQHEGLVEVGDVPTTETWPKECPACKKDHFYLAMNCPQCRKTLPMKSPDAEKFGLPKICPFCKKPADFTGS